MRLERAEREVQRLREALAEMLQNQPSADGAPPPMADGMEVQLRSRIAALETDNRRVTSRLAAAEQALRCEISRSSPPATALLCAQAAWRIFSSAHLPISRRLPLKSLAPPPALAELRSRSGCRFSEPSQRGARRPREKGRGMTGGAEAPARRARAAGAMCVVFSILQEQGLLHPPAPALRRFEASELISLEARFSP